MKKLKEDENLDNEMIWWVCFRIALAYDELGASKLALKWLQKAVKYTEIPARIIQNYWELGMISEKSNINLAIKYYDVAIQECLEIKHNVFLISLVGNKAILQDDIVAVQKTEKLLSKITEEECQYYYRSKEYMYNVVYENYAKIYIHTKQFIKARHAINQIINNDNKKDELRQELLQAVKKAC
jgi:tetratricopeptide (TPR) repeat protein